MPKATYDNKKVRKAMWLAPLIGALGLLPFILQLNLSALQFSLVVGLAVMLVYLAGFLIGGLGYWVLDRLGYNQSGYLMAYAVLLIGLAPILLDDVYALLAFGPPILLASAAFCYLRGSALAAPSASAA